MRWPAGDMNRQGALWAAQIHLDVTLEHNTISVALGPHAGVFRGGHPLAALHLQLGAHVAFFRLRHARRQPHFENEAWRRSAGIDRTRAAAAADWDVNEDRARHDEAAHEGDALLA